MENTLQRFQNEEFGRLEILMIGDKPYFPAFACARVLGYKRPNDAITQHCRCTVKHRIPHPQSPGKAIEVNFIPEGDLYRLIIRSKLPAAERFEKWVFDDVLPSIRKHGAYITPEAIERMLSSSEFTQVMLETLLEEQAENDRLKERLSSALPKARYCEALLQCPDVVPISVIAKDYGMAAAAFNQLLHRLGIQYRAGSTWLLYQRYAGKGYTRTRTYYVNETTASTHTYWTQRGRLFLYEILRECGIVPGMNAAGPAFHAGEVLL